MSAAHWLGPYNNADDALNELRKSVAKIIGEDPETWPDHGNAPLAIAATLALARRTNPAPAQEPVAVPAGDEAPTSLLVQRAREMADEINKYGKCGELTAPYAAILLREMARRLEAAPVSPPAESVAYSSSCYSGPFYIIMSAGRDIGGGFGDKTILGADYSEMAAIKRANEMSADLQGRHFTVLKLLGTVSGARVEMLHYPAESGGVERLRSHDEEIEELAQWLHDEGGFGDAWTCHTWPEHPDDDGRREGGYVKLVPSDVQAKFRDVARRLLRGRTLASAPAPQPADHRRVQDAAPTWPELDALFAEAKEQAPQPVGGWPRYEPSTKDQPFDLAEVKITARDGTERRAYVDRVRGIVLEAEPSPSQPGGAVKQRVLERISVFASYSPEEGESWESWYHSAFDLLASEVAALEPSPSRWNAGAEATDWRERDLDLIAAHEKAEAFEAGAKAMLLEALSAARSAIVTSGLDRHACIIADDAITQAIRALPLPTPAAGEDAL